MENQQPIKQKDLQTINKNVKYTFPPLKPFWIYEDYKISIKY